MLIKCPECQKEISDRATNCPNCGFPISNYSVTKSLDNHLNFPMHHKVVLRKDKFIDYHGDYITIKTKYFTITDKTENYILSYFEISSSNEICFLLQNKNSSIYWNYADFSDTENIEKMKKFVGIMNDRGLFQNRTRFDVINNPTKEEEILKIECSNLIKETIKDEQEAEKIRNGNNILIVLCVIFGFLAFMLWIGVMGDTSSEITDNGKETYQSDYDLNVENEKKETVDKSVKTEEEINVPTFEEYSEECKEYNYKDVLRNPSDYVGEKVKIEVEISSVHEESLFNAGKYYFAYSKENKDSNYYHGDMYGIFDNRYNTDLKLLEDDVIMVYGEIVESEYTKSFILSSDELFCIDMKFVELISE